MAGAKYTISRDGPNGHYYLLVKRTKQGLVAVAQIWRAAH